VFGIGSPEGRGLNPHVSPAHVERIPSPANPERITSPAHAERGDSASHTENIFFGLMPGRPARMEKRPEQVQASSIDELTSGHPGVEGVVTVKKVKLSSDTREVVINGASGVQIGPHNRQLNSYDYEMVKPHISVGPLFEGRPGLQSSFERLAAHPDSKWANYAFRHRLTSGPLYEGGRMRRVEILGSRHARFTAHFNDQHALAVVGSEGIQVGGWNTQRNRFIYRIEHPELHLDAVLRGHPELVHDLAVAAKYPDNRAVLDSFTHRLRAAVGKSSGQVRNVREGYSGTTVRSEGGQGVQVGRWNIRVDKVGIRAGKVILTHWEPSDLPGSPGEDVQRGQRLQASHLQRISESRPPGFAAQNTYQIPENLLCHCTQQAATVMLDEIAPGRRHLAAWMAKEMETALDDPEERRSRVRLSAGITLAEAGILRQGSSRGEAFGLGPSDEGATVPPRVELINFADHERRLRQSGGAGIASGSLEGIDAADTGDLALGRSESGGGSSWAERPGASGGLASVSGSSAFPTNHYDHEPVLFPPAEARAKPSVSGDWSEALFATGAVVCGSAAAIGEAMGTRILDADILLAYVRRRIWDNRYDGRHHSVMPTMRAVQGLQLVVFLDPFLGRGMWIDVDPARQVPAAWLLIEMDLSDGLPGRFRFFRS
jgi:hypothetical protein